MYNYKSHEFGVTRSCIAHKSRALYISHIAHRSHVAYKLL